MKWRVRIVLDKSALEYDFSSRRRAAQFLQTLGKCVITRSRIENVYTVYNSSKR